MRAITRIIFIIAITTISLSLYSIIFLKSPDKTMSKSFYTGKAKIGGHFTLKNSDSQSISSQDFKKLKLVYFGFTHCPDICPAGLNQLSNILNLLENNNVQAFFITIDPERDNEKQLASFMSNFNEKIIGLTGAKEEINKVADLFKVYRAKQENPDSPHNYMINHSSFIYLLDKDDKYLAHFSGDMEPEKIVKEIRNLMK